jgi:hypothetical protein
MTVGVVTSGTGACPTAACLGALGVGVNKVFAATRADIPAAMAGIKGIIGPSFFANLLREPNMVNLLVSLIIR